MPTYVAFLRAINLGAVRKLPRDAVRAATEAGGGTDVDTYLNTGNVRLTHRARSSARVAGLLERAYADEAGFDVPTIVFTPAEVAALTARGGELDDLHRPAGKHYVTLYAEPPAPEAVAAVEALEHPGERVVVEGRAAYALLDGDVHTSRVLAARAFKDLGPGTARTLAVLRTVTERWC